MPCPHIGKRERIKSSSLLNVRDSKQQGLVITFKDGDSCALSQHMEFVEEGMSRPRAETYERHFWHMRVVPLIHQHKCIV